MKRRLTLAGIAIALGMCGWGSAQRIHAADEIPAKFEQTEPVVGVAPDAAGDADNASDEDTAASDDAASSEPEAPAPTPTAEPEPPAAKPIDEDEPLAIDEDEEPAKVDSGSAAAAEKPAPSQDSESDTSPSADEVLATDEPPSQISEEGTESEVIRERYPNRAIKIEREVTQDAEGNYVNHGSWKMWDTQGSLVVEGQYHYGQRIGVWNRWYRAVDVDLLKAAPYSAFKGPFISQASFDLGRLEGKWSIYDGHQHKISECEFADGQRHGKLIWWYPSGQKMRECNYDHGELHGQLQEWGTTGRLVVHEAYQHGRKIGSRVDQNRAEGSRTEGSFLFAREVVQSPDDWWNAKLAAYGKQGKDERHGHWVTWYPNGQKQLEGEYDHDVQVGRFNWWFANGQRAIQGDFVDGEQQGKWVWWHENGQKSIQGDYRQGHPIGQWTWWNDDGKIAKSSKLEEGAGEIVQVPVRAPKPAPPATRSATRPNSDPSGQSQPSTIR